MNIVDAILLQCRINPASTAIIVPGGRIHIVTYSGLEQVLNSLTRVVLTLGFAPGDVVGIRVDDKVFHIGLMLALMRLGVIGTSCGNRPLPQEVSTKAIIADRALPSDNAGRTIRADPRWLSGDRRSLTDPRLKQTDDDDDCQLLLTRASSGPARVVALNHRMTIERNADLDFSHGARFPRCARLHCDMDLSAAAAFRYVTYVLMRGGTILLRGGSAAEIETSKTVYRIEHMVTSQQDFQQHVNFYKSERRYRCELDHVVVLGDPLSRELAALGREHMTRNVISCYGFVETGPVAAADSREIAGVSGATGYVLPGVTVEIVDLSDARLPLGAEGLMRVRSGTMVGGYFGNPEQTRRSFRDGFFYPGDRGYLTQKGLLVVSRRAQVADCG